VVVLDLEGAENAEPQHAVTLAPVGVKPASLSGG
jgi:hypothetical protein